MELLMEKDLVSSIVTAYLFGVMPLVFAAGMASTTRTALRNGFVEIWHAYQPTYYYRRDQRVRYWLVVGLSGASALLCLAMPFAYYLGKGP